MIQLPQVLPRFIDVGQPGEYAYVLLEDILAEKLPELFGGYEIAHRTLFRITRDMDIDLLEQEGDDLLRAIEKRLRERQHTEAVRLEVQADVGRDLLRMLVQQEELHLKLSVEGDFYSEVYKIDGMLDMTDLWEIIPMPLITTHLREPPFEPRQRLSIKAEDDLFAKLATQDVLLHHPLRFV